MLTDDPIASAIAVGKLIPARPITPWVGEPRAFIMCKPLYDAINEGKTSKENTVRARWAQLEADISYFIEGGYITRNRLKQLEPYKYEHWELISLRPRPSLRVFGRFAKPDVFVGTHVIERRVLKGKWDIKWEIEKLNCEEHWNGAGLTQPFSASSYEEYITDNASLNLRLG